mgnify:CR=1 FL=1
MRFRFEYYPFGRRARRRRLTLVYDLPPLKVVVYDRKKFWIAVSNEFTAYFKKYVDDKCILIIVYFHLTKKKTLSPKEQSLKKSIEKVYKPSIKVLSKKDEGLIVEAEYQPK